MANFSYWFVVLSPWTLALSGWMAYKCRLWFRWITYHLSIVVMMYYHSCHADSQCEVYETSRQIDHSVGLWLASSAVLLLGHFPHQAVELICGFIVMGACYGFIAMGYDGLWWQPLLFLVLLALLVISLTWPFKGPVPIRIGWLVAGLIMSTATIAMYYLGEHVYRDNILHGLFHISISLTLFLLCYGMRSPEFFEGYYLMEDL